MGFILNTLHALLPEDGGRLPKHVAVKVLYCFYMQFLCSDYWFLITRKIGRFSAFCSWHPVAQFVEALP